MLNFKPAIFLLILVYMLCSCSQVNKSAKLLSNIEVSFKKTKNLDHGSLVALYDLAGFESPKCLFAKNYGQIINDEKANSQFLNKALRKYKKGAVERRTHAKFVILKNDLLKLHDKYMILSSSDIRKMHLKENDENSIFDNMNDDEIKSLSYLRDFYKLDLTAKYVPIFFPVNSARLTSHFGMRKHPLKGGKKFHYGTDFAGAKSTPVYASAYGKVSSVERASGYGNTIVIDHHGKFQTRYAHLSKVFVSIGENIIRGQKVGLQGRTGVATSEHLHFEILFNGKHLNPIDFVGSSHNCSAH